MVSRPHLPLQPYRVAVLCGGSSAERDVSLESGAGVAAALNGAGHHARTIDPAKTLLTQVDWRAFDVAFLALHGTWGEDGQVQSILEGLGVPYTGSDAAVSKLAFHKSAAKERFIQCGVPTPASVLIHESDDASRIHLQARKLGYPLVVKPDAQGSSLGISLIDSPDALPEALVKCFHLGAFGLIETLVAGSEWTVGVVDDLVLPAIQIETPRAFYDYEAKYHDDRTQYLFDVDQPPAVLRAIETAGVKAARALGTSGLARVDLRVDRLGQPWVLEVNTIPGMTSHSLIPKAAARVGIGFSDLCERAIQSALRRAKIAIPESSTEAAAAARVRRVG